VKNKSILFKLLIEVEVRGAKREEVEAANTEKKFQKF
jgi:hypothetical protein